MESIGDFFKQVRETKGLTVDEVASKTRIRADFVKALEEGNFAKLPDQVFARGFVRSYARSLGLDEEDAIHRFIQSAGAFYEKQDERERLKVRQAQEERKRQANRKAVAIAIGIAILTLVFLLSREQSSLLVKKSTSESSSKRSAQTSQEMPEVPRPAAESASSSSKAKPVEATPQPASKPDLSPSRVSPLPTSTASAPPSIATPAVAEPALNSMVADGTGGEGDPMVLDLEATELSWVVIQIDGGSPQEALLRPGEKAKWKGAEQFVLTLGNAGGIKAELNGKPQKPFGPSGKVVRDVVLKR